jgi:pimeloyl-ACP methyl ester carboxylesterase
MTDPTTLAASRVAGSDATTVDVVMLHGIYGRGRNWQAVARGLVAACPEVACWLVDLPHHGASGPGRHGDSVDGLAQDVLDWAASQGVLLRVVLGHSYGGKVALAMAKRLRGTPLQVWVIDSTPDVKPPSGSAWEMLAAVRGLPDRFASREEAQAGLRARGYDQAVAQWMTTNLGRDGESFRWQLDFDAMGRLLEDFFVTSAWPVLESPDPRHDIHILKATRSNTIEPDTLARISAATGPRVHLHELEGGHWIHAERPDAVTALIAGTVPAPLQSSGE